MYIKQLTRSREKVINKRDIKRLIILQNHTMVLKEKLPLNFGFVRHYIDVKHNCLINNSSETVTRKGRGSG